MRQSLGGEYHPGNKEKIPADLLEDGMQVYEPEERVGKGSKGHTSSRLPTKEVEDCVVGHKGC